MDFKEALKDPKKIIFSLGMKGKLGFISDEKYLKLMYWANIGKRLNLENPVTFNEKLQWLKLHNQNPEYSKMVDKYEAKNGWLKELETNILFLHWEYGILLTRLISINYRISLY